MDVGSYIFFLSVFSLAQFSVAYCLWKTIQREMTGNASLSFIHGAPGGLSSRKRIIRSSKIGGHER